MVDAGTCQESGNSSFRTWELSACLGLGERSSGRSVNARKAQYLIAYHRRPLDVVRLMVAYNTSAAQPTSTSTTQKKYDTKSEKNIIHFFGLNTDEQSSGCGEHQRGMTPALGTHCRCCCTPLSRDKLHRSHHSQQWCSAGGDVW